MPGLRRSPRLCWKEEAKNMGEASLAQSKQLLPLTNEGAEDSQVPFQDTSHDSSLIHKSVLSKKARQLSPRRDSHTPKVLIVPLVTDSDEDEDVSKDIHVEQSLSNSVAKVPLDIDSDEDDFEDLPVEQSLSDSTAKQHSSPAPSASCVNWANISTSTVMDKFLPGTSMNPVLDTFHDSSMEDISVDLMKRKREQPGLGTVPSKSALIKNARHKAPGRSSHSQNVLIVSGDESDTENNFPSDQPKSTSSAMQHSSPAPSSSSTGAGWTKIRTSTVTDKLLPGISMMRTSTPPQPRDIRRGLATVDLQTVSAGVDAERVNSDDLSKKTKSRKELLAGLNGVSVTNIQCVQDLLSGEVEFLKTEQGLGNNVQEAKIVVGMVFDLTNDDDNDDDDDVQEVENVGFVNPWIKDESCSTPLQPGISIGSKFNEGSFTVKTEGKALLITKSRGMRRGGRITQADHMPEGYQYSPVRKIVLPGAGAITPRGSSVSVSTPRGRSVMASTPRGRAVRASTPRGRAVRASTPRGGAVRASTPRGRGVPSPVISLGPGRGAVRSRGGRGVGGNMAMWGGMRGGGSGAHLIPSPQQVINSDSWMMPRTPTSGRANISSPRVDVSLVIPASALGRTVS